MASCPLPQADFSKADLKEQILAVRAFLDQENGT
jgi:hypothetical protein